MPAAARAGDGRVVVSGYDAGLHVLSSSLFVVGRSAALARLAGRIGNGPGYRYVSRRLVMYDPPEHTRIRGNFSRVLTRRRVDGLQRFVLEMTDRLLDQGAEAGEMDLVEGLTATLPPQVTQHMIGVPESLRPSVSEWTSRVSALAYPTSSHEEVVEAEAALESTWRCLEELAEFRRRRPTTDLISTLVGYGCEPSSLSREELIANMVFLLCATRELATKGLISLFQHPEHTAALRRNGGWSGVAVEECLRHDSGVVFTTRVAATSTEIAGIAIEAGERVDVHLMAANHDPGHFPGPQTIAVGPTGRSHLAFGAGIHYCLGARLVRLQLSLLLRRLLERFSEIELDSDAIEWQLTSGVLRANRAPMRVR